MPKKKTHNALQMLLDVANDSTVTTSPITILSPEETHRLQMKHAVKHNYDASYRYSDCWIQDEKGSNLRNPLLFQDVDAVVKLLQMDPLSKDAAHVTRTVFSKQRIKGMYVSAHPSISYRRFVTPLWIYKPLSNVNSYYDALSNTSYSYFDFVAPKLYNPTQEHLIRKEFAFFTLMTIQQNGRFNAKLYFITMKSWRDCYIDKKKIVIPTAYPTGFQMSIFKNGEWMRVEVFEAMYSSKITQVPSLSIILLEQGECMLN